MVLWGLVGMRMHRCNSRLCRLLLIIAIAGLSFSVTACTGKLPDETPPGTYTLTVIGTDTDSKSNIVPTADLHLTVPQ
jgi:hypothetical protein